MFEAKIVNASVFGLPLLTLLGLVPVVGYWLAKRQWPARLFTIVGAAFGAVVSPLALGLYSLYLLSPWGLIPGLLGLALSVIHGTPGFTLATSAGLVSSGVVTNLESSAIIESINGFVWGLAYGLFGFAIDRYRSRKRDSS